MRIFLLSASALALAACGGASTDTPTPASTPETPTTETVEATAGPTDVDYGNAGSYEIDTTHTAILWSVKHLGLSNYTGRFTNVDATLNWDPSSATATSLTATIDTSSVYTGYVGDYKKGHGDSGYETWDEQLGMDGQWLNAKEFPEIMFTATEITKTGADTGKVTGDLTFLGVTKPVTLDVKYNGALVGMRGQDKIGFSATTTIDRTDFGFGTYAPNIGAEVDIRIETEFGKPAEG